MEEQLSKGRPVKGTSVCDATLGHNIFYAPTVTLGPLISYRQVLQGDPVKIWAIWGRQNLLVILLTALTSVLIFFHGKFSCPWYCSHSGEGFSLHKRKAVNKRPFFCERWKFPNDTVGSEVSCRHFCYFLQMDKTQNSIQHAFGPNSSLTAPTRSYETFNFSLTSGQIKLARPSLWPPKISDLTRRQDF